MEFERKNSIDILRCIALLGIIIIHCGPTSLIVQQLRGFDVPLMVFLSGVSYKISSKRNKSTYKQYLWRRFKRLIVPTWLFITFYIVLIYIITSSLPEKRWIINTYTFYTSWYVWIIRVLLLLAIIVPLVVPFIQKHYSVVKYIITNIIFIIVYELLPLRPEGYSSYALYLFIEFIPYLFIFLYGYEINRFTKFQQSLVSTAFYIVYLSILVYLYNEEGCVINTSTQKYPPHIYYTSYAMGCIGVLWLLKEKITYLVQETHLTKFLCFIGRHTIWIYLWHIVVLTIIGDMKEGFEIKFIIVALGALVITYIQSLTITWINKRIISKSIQKNLQLIFNG